MPGLVPGIHALASLKKDVDGRDFGLKTRFALLPGHDGLPCPRELSGFADEFQLSGRFQRPHVEAADLGGAADIQRH
jgi:hypothetical protein